MRPNIKGNNVQKNGRDNRASPLSNKENANVRSNQIQEKRNIVQSNQQNSKIDEQTVNNETQKKSQTLAKGEGKKIPRKTKSCRIGSHGSHRLGQGK